MPVKDKCIMFHNQCLIAIYLYLIIFVYLCKNNIFIITHFSDSLNSEISGVDYNYI